MRVGEHLTLASTMGRVTLQAPIREAIAEHRLGPVESMPAEQTVATFARPGGEPIALVGCTSFEVLVSAILMTVLAISVWILTFPVVARRRPS